MRGIMMEDAKTDAAPAQTLIESERAMEERWSWHEMAESEVDDGAGEIRTWRYHGITRPLIWAAARESTSPQPLAPNPE